MSTEKFQREGSLPPILIELHHDLILDKIRDQWIRDYPMTINYQYESQQTVDSVRWAQIGQEIVIAYVERGNFSDAADIAKYIRPSDDVIPIRDDTLYMVGLASIYSRSIKRTSELFGMIYNPSLRKQLLDAAIDGYCTLDDVTEDENEILTYMLGLTQQINHNANWNGSSYPSNRYSRLVRPVRIREPFTRSHCEGISDLLFDHSLDGYTEALKILNGIRRTFPIGTEDPINALELVFDSFPSEESIAHHVTYSLQACSNRSEQMQLLWYYASFTSDEMQVLRLLHSEFGQVFEAIFSSELKPTSQREQYTIKQLKSINIPRDKIVESLFASLNGQQLERWLPYAVGGLWEHLDRTSNTDIAEICKLSIPPFQLTSEQRLATGERFAQYMTHITTMSAYDTQYLVESMLLDLIETRFRNWANHMRTISKMSTSEQRDAYIRYYRLGEHIRDVCDRPPKHQ